MEKQSSFIFALAIVVISISAICVILDDGYARKKAKNEINRMIAEEYDLEYTSDSDLDKKVDFYEYHPAALGDKAGAFYVVEGTEYKGENREINEKISTYVTLWFD
jgi:hypothetical protein